MNERLLSLEKQQILLDRPLKKHSAAAAGYTGYIQTDTDVVVVLRRHSPLPKPVPSSEYKPVAEGCPANPCPAEKVHPSAI